MKLRSVPFTVSTANVTLSDSGDLIAAVTGKILVIWSIRLHTNATTQTFKFQSAGTTDLTGTIPGTVLEFDAIPIHGDHAIPVFETASGGKLNLVCSAAATVGGYIIYSTADQ